MKYNSDIQIEETRERVNSLQVLDQQQIAMIDEALSSLEKFGELRLIIENGKLRYLVTQISIDVLKYSPGDFTKEGMVNSNPLTKVID